MNGFFSSFEYSEERKQKDENRIDIN